MDRKVRFNDKVRVHYVTNDNTDRRPDLSWMLDRLRFTDRINRTECVLKPVLLKHIASTKNESKE